MVPDWIEEPFDVSAKGLCGLLPCLETGAPDHLGFDGFEHGLNHRIVVTVSLATHRSGDVIRFEKSLIVA